MSVDDSWRRITAWCATYAPASMAAIRRSAPASEILSAQDETSAPWPEDLREWYALADGTEIEPEGTLLPFFRPLPLQEVVAQWRSFQDIWAQLYPPNILDDTRRQRAGTIAAAFIADYVPIADNGVGSRLFVDTRPGERSGCVGEFSHGDLDTDGPIWDSVAAMLTAVADSLERNQPCNGWQPTTKEQQLVWQFL